MREIMGFLVTPGLDCARALCKTIPSTNSQQFDLYCSSRELEPARSWAELPVLRILNPLFNVRSSAQAYPISFGIHLRKAITEMRIRVCVRKCAPCEIFLMQISRTDIRANNIINLCTLAQYSGRYSEW